MTLGASTFDPHRAWRSSGWHLLLVQVLWGLAPYFRQIVCDTTQHYVMRAQARPMEIEVFADTAGSDLPRGQPSQQQTSWALRSDATGEHRLLRGEHLVESWLARGDRAEVHLSGRYGSDQERQTDHGRLHPDPSTRRTGGSHWDSIQTTSSSSVDLPYAGETHKRQDGIFAPRSDPCCSSSQPACCSKDMCIWNTWLVWSATCHVLRCHRALASIRLFLPVGSRAS